MHSRSVKDKLHRDQVGQWVRLPDDIPANVEAIKDMLEATVDSYDATYKIATFTGTPQELPSDTPDASAVSKAYNKYDISVAASDVILAIYWEGVYDDTGTHATHGQVDWVILPFAGAAVPTLNVQLYNNTKARTDTVVEVKLLEDDLTDAGLDPVNCYDPHQEFSAGLANDAVGRATLVRDADTGDTRLEFTHLRGPAAWICATLDEDMGASPVEATASVNSYHGLDWSNEDPSDGSGDVTVLPCSGMHDNLQSGDKVVAVLKDPDTDPIEYLIVEANGSREMLIAKLTVDVNARSGDDYGTQSTSTVSLGHLAAGDWEEVLTEQTVYNPSLSPVIIPPSGEPEARIDIPVNFINGHWVLLNAMDLHQVSGFDEDDDQSIGHDAADSSIEWQDDSECPE